jgi:hypothetical protein
VGLGIDQPLPILPDAQVGQSAPGDLDPQGLGLGHLDPDLAALPIGQGAGDEGAVLQDLVGGAGGGEGQHRHRGVPRALGGAEEPQAILARIEQHIEAPIHRAGGACLAQCAREAVFQAQGHPVGALDLQGIAARGGHPQAHDLLARGGHRGRIDGLGKGGGGEERQKAREDTHEITRSWEGAVAVCQNRASDQGLRVGGGSARRRIRKLRIRERGSNL